MNAMYPIAPVTIEEFEAMEKDERLNYELIDGVVMMSPSPTPEHQNISGNVYYHSKKLLKSTSCKPYFELDVKSHGDSYRPDVLIRCQDNLDLPKIVFEVISPSSRHLDLMVKLINYKRIGILEYWIIDPKSLSVTVHDFVNNGTESYTGSEQIQSKVLPELMITVTEIFED